jgi:hypothetical protein
MPVEIREIIIRAVVTDTGGGAQPASSESTAESSGKEEIINECVEQVLEILKNQKER